MVTRWLDDGVMGVLGRALEGASLRHQALSNNIANTNTPGFKRSDVTFAGSLARALEQQRPGSSSGTETVAAQSDAAPWGPRLITQHHTSGRNDGNNVELELEMTLLSSNALWYQALTRQVSERFSRIRAVINDGRH